MGTAKTFSVNYFQNYASQSPGSTFDPGLDREYTLLRAILGLPLGDTQLNHYSGLVNILGEQDEPLNLASLSASAAVHWYNKPFAPGRKLGHLGLSADSSLELQRQVRQLHHELSTPGNHA